MKGRRKKMLTKYKKIPCAGETVSRDHIKV